MRLCPALALIAMAAPLAAQNWYVPDNDPTVGTCNVIPFGQPTAGSFYNSFYQTRITAADLGSTPNLITGLGFACCSTGTGNYAALEIWMDHIPAAQPLDLTFANNLTPAAIPVLLQANYTWSITANAWNEVGLQNFFPYNGVDDVVVQIAMTDGTSPAGMRRGTRQRVYWIGASGPAAATGTSGSAASKMEISMLTARTSTYGVGCPGSNGTPLLGFTGQPQPNTPLGIDLLSGVPNGFALAIFGNVNSGLYPFDLSLLSAPGCFLYTDLGVIDVVPLDGAGSGQYLIGIPQQALGSLLYTQYACLDPAANGFGFTTSNYGRILIGN